MFKKILAVLTGMSMTAAMMTGCGGQQQDAAPQPDAGTEPAAEETAEAPGTDEVSTGEITLNLYHSWSAETTRGEVLAKLVEEFNEQHTGEIKVVVETNPDFPAYQEKVKTMLSTKTAPDIFHYNYNPNDLSYFESGLLMDFTPYMDEEWKGKFEASDLETVTYDGKLLSIPFESAGAVIWYNKDVFAEVGITEFPDTWDGLLEACKTLKDAGYGGFSLYTGDDAWYSINLITGLWIANEGAAKVNTSTSFQTPGMIDALNTYKEFCQYSTSDVIGGNYSVAGANFSSKKTTMAIDGSWFTGYQDESVIPSISAAPMPTNGDGVAEQGYLVTDAQTPWAASAQTDPAKEAAIAEFLKFITSEEATKTLTMEGSVVLSAKAELTEEDLSNVTEQMAAYLEVNGNAPSRTTNLERNLSTEAAAELPTLLESFLLDQITTEQFCEQLDALN